jgi:hypothetical protein
MSGLDFLLIVLDVGRTVGTAALLVVFMLSPCEGAGPYGAEVARRDSLVLCLSCLPLRFWFASRPEG